MKPIMAGGAAKFKFSKSAPGLYGNSGRQRVLNHPVFVFSFFLIFYILVICGHCRVQGLQSSRPRDKSAWVKSAPVDLGPGPFRPKMKSAQINSVPCEVELNLLLHLHQLAPYDPT